VNLAHARRVVSGKRCLVELHFLIHISVFLVPRGTASVTFFLQPPSQKNRPRLLDTQEFLSHLDSEVRSITLVVGLKTLELRTLVVSAYVLLYRKEKHHV
jgi:hypothetical protein